MTVPVAPQPRLDDVVPFSPLNTTDVVGNTPLIWTTFASDFVSGTQAHFQVQLSTDSNFTTLILNAISAVSTANFQYESSPGVWIALPATGLPEIAWGSNVRYLTSGLTITTYWWRARQLDQV